MGQHGSVRITLGQTDTTLGQAGVTTDQAGLVVVQLRLRTTRARRLRLPPSTRRWPKACQVRVVTAIGYCLSWTESDIEWSDEDGESFSEHIPSNSDRKLPSEDDCKLTKPNLESHPIPRTARVRPVGVQLALGANSERAVQTDGNRARLEGWKQIEIPEGILPASKGNSGPATEEYQTGRGDQEPKSHEGETVNSGKKRRKGKRRGKESKKKHQNKQKRRQAKAGHLVQIYAVTPTKIQTHGI
ncbi:hypothetical protein TREMEDRAFT_64306 [Tremella mesenterica DSM 1558]|uniref:uncharacterized protein n=1 Tax=Tremella mesenterica (strain ATCC 24925 / CBS 8224 / DSM 1558 / NBRC 9311 / NRRL Y-6157 / RJB 2259-6 / UBC 559-6) TaxID=578456 RepID=UPI0003F49A56|nr:uncharacterized protein TREMEDRAFT_64306 [Tremella mesenterica DSM 1558]EIW67714.1 hypothetical protein TREMEDRAFT_64306 [Tremella mesenterica DSM 1558]